MEVREGMSEVVLTVGPDHSLREAARMMTERKVGRMSRPSWNFDGDPDLTITP